MSTGPEVEEVRMAGSSKEFGLLGGGNVNGRS